MSGSNLTWQPCFVDPWRGVAHFDGITIEADPITSARPNRVLPCLLDEQVLFCRLVEALISSDTAEDLAIKRAIDLGTGSGVFTLYISARLGLKVTGLDCCKRAIDFAKHNKRAYERATGAQLQNCSFQHVMHWSVSPERVSEPVDFVFFNAPFSPVVGGGTLPLCADGGPDGQEPFRSALSVAAKLLRPQGRLFAVQLLLTDSQGNPKYNIFECEDGSSPWSEVRVYPILAERPIPVTSFVEDQYRSQANLRNSPQAILREDHYSFVFLEFTKGESLPGSTPTLLTRGDIPIRGLPKWTWSERILWHRAVLENTIKEHDSDPDDAEEAPYSKNKFPSISLFLDRSHPPLLRYSGVHEAFTPVQAILDRWVELNGLLESDGGSSGALFDCIMIESAPWHPAQRRLDLRTQTVIWARQSSDASKTIEGHKLPVARALRRILREIGQINAKKRSVFRHPDLEEIGQSRLWQPAVLKVFSETDSELIQRIIDDPNLNGPLPIQTEAAKDDLKVNYERNAATYLHPLKEFNIGETNPAKLGSLEECISAALHAYTAICRQEKLLEAPPTSCYFCLLPLPTAQPRSQAGTSGTLYVYGWSTQEWTPDHETAISDLARAAGALYEEEYSEEAKMEIGRLSRHKILRSAAHETRTLISAIQPGLIPEFAGLIRDYLNLQLELEPLGSTFSAPVSLLKSRPMEALRQLAEQSFIFEQLSANRWKASQLTTVLLLRWREEATRLIDVDNSEALSRLSKIDEEDISSLHFVAGFVAAVRNAIKNSMKKPRLALGIVIHARQENLVIENTYTSGSDDTTDQQAYRDKQDEIEQSGGKKVGSEQVIAHHANEFLDGRDFQKGFRFIRKKKHKKLKEGSYEHVWETRFPLPPILTMSP